MLPLLLSLCLAGTHSARAGGFRGDGSGAWPEASSPETWSPSHNVAWRADLPAWSNGSPVRFGGLVCVTAEPTTVLCFDAATGKEAWRATGDYADSLQGAARQEWLAVLATLPDRERAFTEARDTLSRLRRELRAHPEDTTIPTRMSETSRSLEVLGTEVDEVRARQTPPDREIVGYASATAVSTPDALYVLFGNGVISSFSETGERRWARWLGPAPKEMRGYHLGTAASPRLIDGILLTGHGRLRGLDPRTGETRWEGPDYTDFGTPATGRLGDTAVAITPEGQVVRVSDGTELATGLPDQWYTGPLLSGEVLYVVGRYGPEQIRNDGHVPASAHRLRVVGDRVESELLWRTELPESDPFFGGPVIAGDLLVAVSSGRTAWALDTRTGEVRWKRTLDSSLSVVYAAPVLAGTNLLVCGEAGGCSLLEAASGTVRAVNHLEGTRAPPLPDATSLYFRGLVHLYRLESSP